MVFILLLLALAVQFHLKMDFVGPLIICIYSSDATVIGSMTTLDCFCPYTFLLALQFTVQ